MLLAKKSGETAFANPRLRRALASARVGAATMDRRAFLKRSGLTIGAGAALSAVAGQLPLNLIGKAQAEEAPKVEVRRTVCTHCSVGCAIASGTAACSA